MKGVAPAGTRMEEIIGAAVPFLVLRSHRHDPIDCISGGGHAAAGTDVINTKRQRPVLPYRCQ